MLMLLCTNDADLRRCRPAYHCTIARSTPLALVPNHECKYYFVRAKYCTNPAEHVSDQSRLNDLGLALGTPMGIIVTDEAPDFGRPAERASQAKAVVARGARSPADVDPVTNEDGGDATKAAARPTINEATTAQNLCTILLLCCWPC